MNLGARVCLIGVFAALTVTAGATAATVGAPTAIYTFQNGADGAFPSGGLIADPAGNLFGVAESGGIANNGVVFELSPPASQSGAWKQTVIYSFMGGADGDVPIGGLVMDAGGNIYGTTSSGGDASNCRYGCGTAFKLATPASGSSAWTLTTIFHFIPSGGIGPGVRLTMDGAGNLFGTTRVGGRGVSCCGVVYELSPPRSGSGLWTQTLLHVFNGYSDGIYPLAGVTLDGAGNLYGTASVGGAFGTCCGVIFELSPTKSGPWTETILHRFMQTDGNLLPTDLYLDNAGNLYGAAFAGEGNGSICSTGCGAAFELSPPPGGVGSWSEQTIYRFPGIPPSPVSNPVAVFYENGTLYGAANSYVSPFQGSLFALSPSGKRFWNIVTTTFTEVEGAAPQSLTTDPAVSGSTTLYGVAFTGGVNDSGWGTVFSWTP